MSKPTRKQIVELSKEWYDAEHQATEFRPAVDAVPVSGKVIDSADIANLVEASLDGWLVVEGIQATSFSSPRHVPRCGT